MKDWMLITLFILILIVAGLLEHNYITYSFDNLGALTTKLEQTVSENEGNLNSAEVINDFNSLQNFWKNREKKLCLFLNHENIEEIKHELSNIEINIDYNEDKQVKLSIAIILNYVEDYKNHAVVSLESIF